MTTRRLLLLAMLLSAAPCARAASFCGDVSLFVYEVAAMRDSAVTEDAARLQSVSMPRAHGYEKPITGLIHWVYRRPAGAPGQVQLDFINQCRAAGLDKGANSHTENQG